MKNFVDVDERLPILKTLPLSFQHLFAMVGATILVPLIIGLDPAVALFTSGVGTLIYILCTKGKIPAYIGSSFSFIVPMLSAISSHGMEAMLSGVMAAGLIYVAVATIIRFTGSNWLNKALPPVLVGSVVIVIGLSLAHVALKWAGLHPDSLSLSPELANIDSWKWITVSVATLFIAVVGSMYFKGFAGIIPILISMIVGYVLAIVLGVVSQEAIDQILSANIIRSPKFLFPKFNINAMILIAPVAFVTLAEHIGHVYVTSNVCKREFVKEPGLHKTILGDGLATMFAGLVGGPPNTTYGENIGVMAITKVYSVWVVGGAAVIAVIMSFIGPVAEAIRYMPKPVMGGVSIMLFGVIASSGFRVFVENKIDFSKKKNLIIASVVIVMGIGGAALSFNVGDSVVEVTGVALATFVGMLLTLVLPEEGNTEEA